MITLVGGSNFKGKDFAQALAPLTLLVGPNGAGKSARLDALRLALLGYVPEHGHLASGALVLARHPERPIEVWIDDEKGRLLRRIAEGKHELEIDQVRVKTQKAATEIIEARFGAHAPVLDAKAFLEGTDEVRRRWLLSIFPQAVELPQELQLIGSGEGDVESAAYLEAVRRHIETNLGQARAELRTAETMAKAAAEAARSVPDPPNAEALQEEYLAALSRRTTYDAEAHVIASARQELELLRRQEPAWKGTPRPAEELQAERERVTRLLERAQRQTRRAPLVERREEARTQLQAMRASLGMNDAAKASAQRVDARARQLVLRNAIQHIERAGAGRCVLGADLSCQTDLKKAVPRMQAELERMEERDRRLSELQTLEDAYGAALRAAGDEEPGEPVSETETELRAQLEGILHEREALERVERLTQLERRALAEPDATGVLAPDALVQMKERLELARDQTIRREAVLRDQRVANGRLESARSVFETWDARRELLAKMEQETLTAAANALEVPELGTLRVDFARGARLFVNGRRFEALSTGERVLALTALLAKATRPPLRFVGVEAGELDETYAIALMHALAVARDEGQIDQVIMCRPPQPVSIPEGWTVERVNG